MLDICKQVEEYLQTSDSLSPLKPRLQLVGSTAEGTRIGGADEIDVSMTFDALSATPFELASNVIATSMVIPEELKEIMTDFKNELGHFCFARFLTCLCTELREGLRFVSKHGNMPKGLSFNTDWHPCPNCQPADDERMLPLMHCETCLPAITYSKLGPCLTFSWANDIWERPTALTMDFIPVFGLRYTGGKIYSLFEKVFWTLKLVQPEGWIKHCEQISKRDRHLLENRTIYGLAAKDKKRREPKDEVICLKLLNYNSTGPNYVIRPGQKVDLSHMEEHGSTKKVYTHLKALKTVLQLDVSSYYIKKNILAFLQEKNRPGKN